MKVIDCHAHWIPPTLADALRERATAPRIAATATGERLFTVLGSRPFDAALGDLDARRSTMRSCGIEMQVLSLPGLFGIDSLPLEESAALVCAFNDAAADAQRVCPERFILDSSVNRSARQVALS